MAENKIISHCQALIIGGSAGSLEVLLRIFPQLNPKLSFPIVIIVHRKNTSDSSLSDLLATRTALPVKEIEDKQALLPGHIYIAPADYHVLFENKTVLSLDDSEKVNYSRPSIDVTFESAAEVFGSDLVCLLLSGANADGSKGLRQVKAKGGRVLIQDLDTAESSYMPQHAMELVTADKILRPEEMADFVNAIDQIR